MKTATFFWKTAATLIATLLLLLTLAVAFASCNKDGDDNKSSDEALYKPSENMTGSEIQALLEEVTAQMSTVRQMAVEENHYYNDETKLGEMRLGEMIREQVDLDAKKEVREVKYKTMQTFSYVENATSYDYNFNGLKQRYKVSDAYWNRSATVAYYAVEVLEAFKSLEWKVDSSTFVGIEGTRKTTVTLTKDKKLASIKTGHLDPTIEIKYAYTGVNPAFPSGFSKSDFPLASQYSLKVVWGEGLGESTFYTVPNSSYIYLNNITSYAPKVEGKTPALYFDDEFTQPFTSSKTVSNSNLVIYVKWVANTSERAWNVGKSSRASILMEKNHR